MKCGEVSTLPIVLHGAVHAAPVDGRVAIVMATYNGCRFIEEQIRSIQAQDYPNWVLYIRDDGSSDGTVQKILQIAQQDHRVRFVSDEFGNQGAIGNFSVLMNFALQEDADYVFFADQDDVWAPEKMSVMLAAMQELDMKFGSKMPLLVHCDLIVVNEKLKTISDSFVKYSRLSPTAADLGVLLCQNQVTGCASVINRALLEMACPVPRTVLMHDWWLALLAAATGKVGFVPKPLVQYRQHAGNVLGAVSFSRRVMRLLFSFEKWQTHADVIRRCFLQASQLGERVRLRRTGLPTTIMAQIDTCANILNVARIKRASVLRAQKIGRLAKGSGFIFALILTVMSKKAKVG